MKKSPLLALASVGALIAALHAQTAPAASGNQILTADQILTLGAAASATAAPRAGRGPVAGVGGIKTVTTKTSYKFFFGAGDAPDGATKVAADMTYNDTRGYGWDNTDAENPAIKGVQPVTIVTKTESGKPDINVVTNDKQFFFSAALAEGNYKVTVTLGHPGLATTQFVKSEVHRLSLENISTKPGEYVTKTFIVSVHTTAYDGGKVGIKAPRESQQEAWSWDNGLTLEFSGDHPSVTALAIEKVDVPTIYLIGDSTSCDQVLDPYSSWGGMITNFFKPEVAFCNLGESGETLAGTLGEHRFDKVWSQMKPGEFLFLQFGHNDMKSTAAGALDTFKANLHRVATETRNRKGNVVFVTPVRRANPNSGFQGYVEAMKEVADEEKVPLLDLNAKSQILYDAFGGGETAHRLLFAVMTNGTMDPTHHNRLGSYEIAKTVLASMQDLKLDMAKYIVDGFHFDPANPDSPDSFHVPESTHGAADKPPGS